MLKLLSISCPILFFLAFINYIKGMIRQFLDKFRDNQSKWLYGLFGVVTLSGIAYIAYKNYKRYKDDSVIHPPSHIQIADTNSPDSKQNLELKVQNYQITKELIKVINCVKAAVKNNKDFAFEAVKAIYQGYYQLSLSQFKQLAVQYRMLRRDAFDNLKVYHELVMHYQKKIQEVRMKHLSSILSYFKLEIYEWYSLSQKYSQSNKEQWEQIIILADVKQLGSLRRVQKPPIHSDLLIQIFKYKSESFTSILATVKLLFKDQWSDTAQIYSFVDRRVSDMVFKRFGAQEQDVFFSMVVISHEHRQIIQRYQQEINTKLQQFLSQGNNK